MIINLFFSYPLQPHLQRLLRRAHVRRRRLLPDLRRRGLLQGPGRLHGSAGVVRRHDIVDADAHRQDVIGCGGVAEAAAVGVI